MNILAFAEQRDGKFKKSAFEVVQAARKAADGLGGTLTAVRLDDRRVYQVPSRLPVTPKPLG